MRSRASRSTDYSEHEPVCTVPNNLPVQLTTFIGRSDDLERAHELCLASRLLTLTGAGGTGKTRFGLRLASRLLGEFPDGVYFVQLAPLFDPAAVPRAISDVLGVPESPGRPIIRGLKDFLSEKQLLLVLDNFEQVTDAGVSLGDLLSACPKLTIVVTSRVPLRVTGEQEFQIPPLALPAIGNTRVPDNTLLTDLASSEAVQLFLERAQAVQDSFELTAENGQAVGRICERLDGLPLAIELAAARIRILPPAAMLDRLQRTVSAKSPEDANAQLPSSRLEFLTSGARDLPERQRTLRSTIGWSYDLLSPMEQALFRRLSVFIGGCTLSAAEAACLTQDVGNARWTFDEQLVLDGIESLIANNLLVPVENPTGQPRFTMLETIREFGLECLSREGELLTLRRWHAQHFLQLAEDVQPLLRGSGERVALDRLQTDHENMRAALEWLISTDRDASLALRLSGALAWFWQARSNATEGRRWIERALEDAPNDAPGRVRALYGLGWLAHIQRDSAAADQALQASLQLARASSDRWAEAWCLHVLGRVAYFDGDADSAMHFADQSLAVIQMLDASDGKFLEGRAIRLRGLSAHIRGDLIGAMQQYEASNAIHSRLGFASGVGVNCCLMGLATYSLGDLGRAQDFLHESLETLNAVGEVWTVNNAIAALAAVAIAAKQMEMGVTLAGVAQSVSETIVVTPIPLTESILTGAIDTARRTLGNERFNTALAAGRSMSLAQGVVLAQSVDARASAPLPRDPVSDTFGLSERELEVLLMVAEGKTNREIADTLVLSIPTVERHLTHVYTKIGVRGRSEATAFALRHSLS